MVGARDACLICLIVNPPMVIGYESAGLTVHPPPKKKLRVGSVFSPTYRCLELPKIFSQRKSGFCGRYAHWNAHKRGSTS